MGMRKFKVGERVVVNDDVYVPVAKRGAIVTIASRYGTRHYTIKEVDEHRARENGGRAPNWGWHVHWRNLEHFPR